MLSILNSEIFSIIKKDLSEHDGKIIFCKGEYCGGNSKCYGIFYFDSEDRPILKIAKGNKTKEEWFGIVIHEYCHFLQWRDNSKNWKEYDKNEFQFDTILCNPKKNRDKILILLKLEADCERRSVKIIRNNTLIDAENYARMANAVLYKYAYLYKYYKWPQTNIKLPELYNLCPDKIIKSYKDYRNIPTEIVKAYA